MSNILELSIVIPVYNEEDNVQPMVEAIEDALVDQEINWEMLFVDDGSVDESIPRLLALKSTRPNLIVVELRGNYGQTPAMVAGIHAASGEVIVTMDGDLQNDPRDIPAMLEHLRDGYDLVVGWREKRQDKLITRKIPSFIANRIIGRVTGVPIRDNGCSLKAYRADLIKNVNLYSEMHRFIPAMASIAGSKVHEMPVRHHARVHGESKYGLKRIYKVLLDLLVVRTLLSSVGNPIKYFTKLALVPALLAVISALGAVQQLMGGQISIVLAGTSLLWSICAMFTMILGLLAEMLYRTDDRKEVQIAKLTTEIRK